MSQLGVAPVEMCNNISIALQNCDVVDLSETG